MTKSRSNQENVPIDSDIEDICVHIGLPYDIGLLSELDTQTYLADKEGRDISDAKLLETAGIEFDVSPTMGYYFNQLAPDLFDMSRKDLIQYLLIVGIVVGKRATLRYWDEVTAKQQSAFTSNNLSIISKDLLTYNKKEKKKDTSLELKSLSVID